MSRCRNKCPFSEATCERYKTDCQSVGYHVGYDRSLKAIVWIEKGKEDFPTCGACALDLNCHQTNITCNMPMGHKFGHVSTERGGGEVLYSWPRSQEDELRAAARAELSDMVAFIEAERDA